MQLDLLIENQRIHIIVSFRLVKTRDIYRYIFISVKTYFVPCRKNRREKNEENMINWDDCRTLDTLSFNLKTITRN